MSLVTPEMFAFGAVFLVALVFSILTIFRQSKVSVVYALFSMILWFTEAGLNLVVFQATPSLLILSWLWFAVGAFFLAVGIVISFLAWKADQDKKEMEI